MCYDRCKRKFICTCTFIKLLKNAECNNISRTDRSKTLAKYVHLSACNYQHGITQLRNVTHQCNHGYNKYKFYLKKDTILWLQEKSSIQFETIHKKVKVERKIFLGYFNLVVVCQDKLNFLFSILFIYG